MAGFDATQGILEQLHNSPFVKSCREIADREGVTQLLRSKEANMLFVDPRFLSFDAALLVDMIRRDFPDVFIVIYADEVCAGKFFKAHEHLRSIPYLKHMKTRYQAEKIYGIDAYEHINDSASALDKVISLRGSRLASGT